MANNVLAMPILDVGVKRQFNTARNICCYYWNSSNALTIKLLIIVKHHNGLLRQVVFTDDGNKNTVNAKLAWSMDRN